jgi:hypothetical protein
MMIHRSHARSERLITSAWWLCTMGLILTTGALALGLCYRGVFSVVQGEAARGAWMVLVGSVLTWAAYRLCSVRDDLVGA